MSSDPRQPHRDASAWNELVASLDQDAMIALIGLWLGHDLRQSASAEDVWQETLAMAWRDRDRHDWRGLAGYRAWLRGIARNRIHDLADRDAAQKRGGTRATLQLSTFETREDRPAALPPCTSTPSREAMQRERAQVMQAALEDLPADYRDLLRMCLLEELPVPAAAKSLGISDATAYRRLLRGSELYRARVQERLGNTRNP